MSLRLRIIIGIGALSLALLTVLGDGVFQAIGFPPGSGRAVVAIALLILALGWFAFTSASWRKAADIAKSRGAKKPDDDAG